MNFPSENKNLPPPIIGKFDAASLAILGLAMLMIGSGIIMRLFPNILPQSQTTLVTPTTESKIEATPSPKPKTAVIADQLSLYYPNSTFIQTATRLLEQANYQVTYIPHDKVTVDFYRNLPKRGDGFILLRVHGTAVSLDQAGEKIEEPFTSLVTAEAEDLAKYPQEIKNGWIGRFWPDNPAEPPTFTVMQGFLTNAMVGQFNHSVIVLMGCDGLRGQRGTGKLFVERGAKAVVGWNDNVSADHMDKAIAYLLEEYLGKKETLDQAMQNTAQVIGADPSYHSELKAMMVGN